MSDSPVCLSLSAIGSAILVATLFTIVFVAQSPTTTHMGEYDRLYDSHYGQTREEPDPNYVPDPHMVPQFLTRKGLYPNDTDSLENEAGILPPFWENTNNNSKSWGPCYWPIRSANWQTEIDKYNDTHMPRYSSMVVNQKNHGTVRGLCRPGFLIIGAGKCGTSSLYHYLVDHPRVLPAKKKQIHYFLYYLKYPMPWYLKHFPTTPSFLGAGALMTGEASPGYMPYPDIPNKIKTHLPGGPPRIISIGRNPLERAYSSYKYNYKAPLLEKLRQGKVKGIPRRKDDAYYEKYIFSLEEMLRAELPILRECLGENGYGPDLARKAWANKTWAVQEFRRRDKDNLQPLIDLDNFCYGGRVNKTVPRRQWINLLAENPEKLITNDNLHLTQSMIGRSLYVLPLDWWYFQYNASDLYFICTEELDDLSGDSVGKLRDFLGLPFFNYSATLSRGAYNVGVNSGYDKETAWNDNNLTSSSSLYQKSPTTLSDLPLSEEFTKELLEFIQPFNERLFELVGRRCNWQH